MRQSTKNTIPIAARLIASIMHTGSLGGCLFFIFDIKTQCLQLGKRLMLDDLPLPVSIFGLVLTIFAVLVLLAKIGNNSFVNLAGKDIANRTINNFIAIGLAFCLVPLILIILSSILMPDDRQMTMPELRSMENEEMKTAKNTVGLAVNDITSFYSIDAAISAIFALKGCRFKNRLIYPFIRD
jgi:hypothetical protein